MDDPRRVVVTGASGFIGGEVARHFRDQGFDVVAFARRPFSALAGVAWAPYTLEGPVPADRLRGACALVHCAYAPGDVALNVAGAERLLAASRNAGVRRNVLLSSLSAREGALSRYGRQKLAIERLFTRDTDTVVRAGLVLGKGGLFAAMREHVRAGRPIPVIGDGQQPVQVIAIGDLRRTIATIVARDLAGLFVVALPDAVPYRRFHEALARSVGGRPRFVRVPYPLASAALLVAEGLGLKLPVARDSLRGLRSMTWVDPRPDLARLGLEPASFEQALQESSS